MPIEFNPSENELLDKLIAVLGRPSYQADLNHFAKFLSDSGCKLDIEGIRHYVDNLETCRDKQDKPLSPRTIARKKNTLRSFLRLLKKVSVVEIDGDFEPLLRVKRIPRP